MNKITELLNNDEIFEEKYSSLDEDFRIISPVEIKEFLRKNKGIFVLLDVLKPYLDEYFLNDEYCLEIIHDSEIADYAQLELTINVSPERLNNGIVNDMEFLNSKLIPFRRKLKIFTEFGISPGVNLSDSN